MRTAATLVLCVGLLMGSACEQSDAQSCTGKGRLGPDDELFGMSVRRYLDRIQDPRVGSLSWQGGRENVFDVTPGEGTTRVFVELDAVDIQTGGQPMPSGRECFEWVELQLQVSVTTEDGAIADVFPVVALAEPEGALAKVDLEKQAVGGTLSVAFDSPEVWDDYTLFLRLWLGLDSQIGGSVDVGWREDRNYWHHVIATVESL